MVLTMWLPQLVYKVVPDLSSAALLWLLISGTRAGLGTELQPLAPYLYLSMQRGVSGADLRKKVWQRAVCKLQEVVFFALEASDQEVCKDLSQAPFWFALAVRITEAMQAW